MFCAQNQITLFVCYLSLQISGTAANIYPIVYELEVMKPSK